MVLFHITGQNFKESNNYVSHNIMQHINFYKGKAKTKVIRTLGKRSRSR